MEAIPELLSKQALSRLPTTCCVIDTCMACSYLHVVSARSIFGEFGEPLRMCSIAVARVGLDASAPPTRCLERILNIWRIVVAALERARPSSGPLTHKIEHLHSIETVCQISGAQRHGLGKHLGCQNR